MALRQTDRLRLNSILVAPLLLAGLAAGYFGSGFELSAGESTNCQIKGNVSYNTGERIYHVPGQEHYSETVITPGRGERWFCSEADARAAGWRRAKR